ncbi:hypothetical protein LzC2_26580 [Planctomycetes bacterium LzC2]|uniref:Uncharacterized protein n=1 Tax=Alienimonas chondri TaxID=2681879 RepID=A0ABX1VFQ1_9PLAN|nr:hypothetical protein [Alienimonas chondri]
MPVASITPAFVTDTPWALALTPLPVPMTDTSPVPRVATIAPLTLTPWVFPVANCVLPSLARKSIEPSPVASMRAPLFTTIARPATSENAVDAAQTI